MYPYGRWLSGESFLQLGEDVLPPLHPLFRLRVEERGNADTKAVKPDPYGVQYFHFFFRR